MALKAIKEWLNAFYTVSHKTDCAGQGQSFLVCFRSNPKPHLLKTSVVYNIIGA